MAKKSGYEIPCFLCDSKLEVRLDKKDHPYFFCDDCAVQTFVRGEIGISNLWNLLRDKKLNKIVNSGSLSRLKILRGLKSEIELIEKELNRIPFLLPNLEDEKRRIALSSKLKAIRVRFNDILNNSNICK